MYNIVQFVYKIQSRRINRGLTDYVYQRNLRIFGGLSIWKSLKKQITVPEAFPLVPGRVLNLSHETYVLPVIGTCFVTFFPLMSALKGYVPENHIDDVIKWDKVSIGTTQHFGSKVIGLARREILIMFYEHRRVNLCLKKQYV